MLVGIINPTGGSFSLFGASGPKGLLAARSRVWTYERAGVEPGAARLPYGLSKAHHI